VACAVVAAFAALALLTQIRALAKLSWFFLTGTTAQLVAIGIVVYELLQNPDPEAKTELVRTSGHYERQFVAIFNMVFAYGGQFAFTGTQELRQQQQQQQLWQQCRCRCRCVLLRVAADVLCPRQRHDSSRVGSTSSSKNVSMFISTGKL
jgi:hypothetical protein